MKNRVSQRSVNATLNFLFFLAVFFSSFSFFSACAAVNNRGDDIADDFLNMIKKQTDGGEVYYSLTDGKAAVEAVFHKKSPVSDTASCLNTVFRSSGLEAKLINLYEYGRIFKQTLVGSSADGFLNDCPDCVKERRTDKMVDEHKREYPLVNEMLEAVGLLAEMPEAKDIPFWVWSGNISGEEKQVAVMPISKDGSLIKVISYKEDRSFCPPRIFVSERCPELLRLSGQPRSQRETVKGKNASAFFHYIPFGSPRQVVQRASVRLQNAGWVLENHVLETESGENNLAVLKKGAFLVSLFASRIRGETNLSAVVTSNDLK